MAHLLDIINDIKARLTHHDGEFVDWLERLHDPVYDDIFSEVVIRQSGKLCLFRYASLGGTTRQVDGQTVADFNSFWQVHDGIHRELRSVTVDLDRVCYVLRPFDKFFNINEQPETKIDRIQERVNKAKSVEFSDKLDGSMQVASWYEGRIVMSGATSLDPAQSWRLADGYSMLLRNEGYVRMISENPDYTFIFEYISMRDMHVVKYSPEDEGLYLIGVRHTADGTCWSYAAIAAIAKRYAIRTTQVFDKTLGQIMSSLNDKRSDEKEGFVLNVDGYFVKIKYNDYIQMHRLLSRHSSCNYVTRMYAEGKIDDVYAKIPEAYRKRVDDIVKVVAGYVNRVTREVERHWALAGSNDPRGIAEYARANNLEGEIRHALFCRAKGQAFDPLRAAKTTKRFKDIATEEEYNRLMSIDG